ncbi:hypothetical protein FGO68_gene15721 [Halteria grandinella]|uniref:Uncharacterized protein n=1 Tax=Halteria grandinella TaxID=5974 RepID=A0A8J8N9G0_HALGN|nr:hypothetical protein FGO68_gene15721 [Halteria grandinella]
MASLLELNRQQSQGSLAVSSTRIKPQCCSFANLSGLKRQLPNYKSWFPQLDETARALGSVQRPRGGQEWRGEAVEFGPNKIDRTIYCPAGKSQFGVKQQA